MSTSQTLSLKTQMSPARTSTRAIHSPCSFQSRRASPSGRAAWPSRMWTRCWTSPPRCAATTGPFGTRLAYWSSTSGSSRRRVRRCPESSKFGAAPLPPRRSYHEARAAAGARGARLRSAVRGATCGPHSLRSARSSPTTQTMAMRCVRVRAAARGAVSLDPALSPSRWPSPGLQRG